MATARINPSRIANMVAAPIGESPTGGDVYEVKLYNAAGELVTHRVDDRFVTNATGARATRSTATRPPKGPELWVMLMEKAWAAQRGGFNNLDFGQASDGLRAVTGKSSTWHNDRRPRATDQILENIWQRGPGRQAGDPATRPGRSPAPRRPGRPRTASRSSPSHAYNVESANRTDRTIDVANPHGRNHLRGLVVGELPHDLRAGTCVARPSVK